jgi:hypothetical protein
VVEVQTVRPFEGAAAEALRAAAGAHARFLGDLSAELVVS